MRSPQTIGVEPDQAGSASFQAMFSVVDQRTGRFFSPLTPFSDGPRHCGQFSAVSGTPAREQRMRVQQGSDSAWRLPAIMNWEFGI